MKTRKIAIVSASALTAGMAHGAVLYTDINHTVGNASSFTFDLNQDGYPDYTASFNNSNANKPYLDAGIGINSPTTYSLVLSGASMGLPLTTNGTPIDASYESGQNDGYFYHDGGDNLVGDWVSNGVDVDGYVGLELMDGGGNLYYGWVHCVYNSTNSVNGNPGTLTLLDCAMETKPNVGILAGQTAESGSSPVVVTPPLSQTNYVGATTQFRVAGTGNPAPTYQWMAGAVGSGVYTNLTDNANVMGSMSNKLTLSGLTLGDQADYVVVLSNTNGLVTNTIPATLTVAPLVIANLSPSPVVLYSGGRASIQVSYVSSVPVTSFQWRKGSADLSDGGNISGSTSSNLVISGLSDTNAGDYFVVLTNIYGAVTSRVDTLTVTTPEMPYQQEMSLMEPSAYYSFNETNNPASNNAVAFDYIGGFNGNYGDNTQNGNPGNNAIAGPQPIYGYAGFDSSNAAVSIISSTLSPSSVVTIPALNLNTNTVTFTAWINPQQTEPAYAVLLSFRSPVAGTANGINYASDGTLGYHWNDDGGTYNYTSGLVPPSYEWSLVALVITPADATFYMFNAEGMSTATNSYPNVVQALNTPGFIGGDTHDPNFFGLMDEVAIFKQSLTEAQLTNLYNVAVTGVVTSPPQNVVMNMTYSNGNCIISWNPAVGLLLQAPSLAGPWTTNAAASSPYEVAPTAAQMFYRVQAP